MSNKRSTLEERRQRAEKANELIGVIAGCGRRFFFHQGRVACLEVDDRGRVWFHDEYTQARIFTHRNGRWDKFTHGGTLRAVVQRLRDYITTGQRLNPRIFGPWPEWYCDGDLWGYGEAMQIVRDAAVRLEIVKCQEESEVAR